jgi:hypothetical protein
MAGDGLAFHTSIFLTLRMLRYLPYFIIFFVTFGVLAVLQMYQPDVMKQLLLTVDVFGFSDAAHQEKEREQAINDLSVTYEEKQILLHHTVFLGASTNMVRLALGHEPVKVYQRVLADQHITVTYFVYYLQDDKRPTILEFANDKLEKAYKGSALDLQ